MERDRVKAKKNTGKYTNVSFATVIEDQGRERNVHVKARIHYRDKGMGDTILLLHEVGLSSDIFKYTGNYLSRYFRVVAPDLPGHGSSDCPNIDFVIEDYSLFIEAFVKTMGLQNITIIACGQSCAYAADYAIYNQNNIHKLVFINPGALRDVKGPYSKLESVFGGIVIKLFKNSSFARRILENAYFDRTIINDQDVKILTRPFERTDVQECVRASIANFDDSAILRGLDQLDMPILYLQGGEDMVSSEKNREDYIAETGIPYELTIRNCGAYPFLEKVENSCQGIMRFMAE